MIQDMSLENAVAVRLAEDVKRRLEAISDNCGLTVAELIRRATEDFITRIEAEGELRIQIRLPGKSETPKTTRSNGR